MNSLSRSFAKSFWKFLPFWFFLLLFKFAGGLHYSLISPFGESLLPLWIVGLLMGGGSIIQLLLDVPAGHALDRRGYLNLLKVTTLVFAFAGVAYMFGLTKVTYLASIVISTFGWLFFGPGINAYILSTAPKESAGRFISLRDVFGSVGTVLASAILPFALLLTPTLTGFILAGLFLLALIALYCSPKDRASVHEEVKIETHHHYIKREHPVTVLKAIGRLNPASTILLLLSFTGSIFYGAIWFVVPLVIAHQSSSGMLGVGLGAFDLAVVVFGYLLGNLADKFNRRALVFFGLLLFALAGIALGFNFGILFILFGFLATTGDETAGLSLWSWLHALDKEHANDGLVAGIINLAYDFGWAIGPIFAGAVYSLVGPTWTIVFAATPILIAWIIYLFMIGKVPALSLAALTPRRPHRPRHRT